MIFVFTFGSLHWSVSASYQQRDKYSNCPRQWFLFGRWEENAPAPRYQMELHIFMTFNGGRDISCAVIILPMELLNHLVFFWASYKCIWRPYSLLIHKVHLACRTQDVIWWGWSQHMGSFFAKITTNTHLFCKKVFVRYLYHRHH